MSNDFSVVIKISQKAEEEFFRVFKVENVKKLHKDLAEALSFRKRAIPFYSDANDLFNKYGVKIDKESFQNFSGMLIQTWHDANECYEYQEYIAKG